MLKINQVLRRLIVCNIRDQVIKRSDSNPVVWEIKREYILIHAFE